MNSRKKWCCSICTFENWPASTKCTICRTARSGTLIEEEMQRLLVCPKENEDKPASTESEHRVPCPSCTYLNNPLSFKCEQCFHVLSELAEFEPVVQKSVPSVSICSPASNSRTVSSEKWSCPLCTYENWPKSKLCVMCGGAPAQSVPTSRTNMPSVSLFSPPPIGLECLEDRIDHESSLSVRQRSKVGFRDKLWLKACLAVMDGDATAVERFISNGGKIEKRLTKQECRYLENQKTRMVSPVRSCATNSPTVSGLVTEDSDLATLPTPGREPQSSDDHTYNFPSGCKIRPGLTLVDLAICCGRTEIINLFITLSGLHATSAAVSMSTSTRSSSRSSTSPCASQGASWQPNVNTFSAGRRASRNQGNTHLQQLLNRNTSLSNRSGIARTKWMPCQASQHIARELRAHLASGIRYNQGEFSCAFLSEWGTFALPYSVGKFPAAVKYLLLSELCDTQAQSELEDDAKAINWWFVPGHKQTSRLFALWNRTAGDCLLDSVLQACWGIFDRENVLRRTLAESLRTCEASFYSRWHDYEALQAACHYILDENQCRRDWENVLSAASQPRGALEQIHIFALSHILRRPIIVYGVKYIKNYRNEPIGIANFQGIYLPLLWCRNFCSPNPIVLGYTRGHFTALVPMEPQPLGSTTTGGGSQTSPTGYSSPYTSPPTMSCSSSRKHSPTPSEDAHPAPVNHSTTESHLLAVSESLLSGGSPNATSAQHSYIYLPLVDRQGVLLPIHFTTEKEASSSQTLLRDWLDVVSTRRGLPLARLRLQTRPVLVDKMIDEWLGSYQTLAKLSSAHTTSMSEFTSPEESDSSETSSSKTSLSAPAENYDKIDASNPEGHQPSHSK